MKKEQIQILVNGNLYEEVDKINHVFGSIFMINWDFYHIMNVEGIKQHMVSAIELVEDLFSKPISQYGEPEPDYKPLPAFVKQTIKTMRKMINNIKAKEPFIKFITNLVLAKDGFGLLPGFGCAITESNEGKIKVKSKLFINPEKQSIRLTK